MLTRHHKEGFPFAVYSSRISGLAKTIQLCEAMNLIDLQATELCAGLSEAQLSWIPTVGKWSIAQNLAHLRTTTRVFLPVVDLALEKTEKLKLHSNGPFHLSPYGHWLVWRMDERPFVRMRAPRRTQPKLLNAAGKELEHFLLSQNKMRHRIEQSAGLNLTALRFPSPLANYLRVNLLELFSLFNAHSRRHLRQANDIRNKIR